MNVDNKKTLHLHHFKFEGKLKTMKNYLLKQHIYGMLKSK